MIIINFILAGLVLVGLVFMLILYLNNQFVVKKFEKNNTIVFGAKGNGKDLLFQLVIKKRNVPYMATQDYGYQYIKTSIKDLNLDPNTFETLIEGNITLSKKHYNWEGHDFYISDGGIYLPSQYDYLLSKLYPSFPIVYATSRHTYNLNIHVNTQALSRVWIKVREQADSYFKMRGAVSIGKYLFLKVRYYSEYKSADAGIMPMVNPGLASKNNMLYSTTPAMMKAQFESMNGIVKDMLCVIKKKHIKYDTRHFHKLFFGISYIDWENEQEKPAKHKLKFLSLFGRGTKGTHTTFIQKEGADKK